MHHRNVNSAVAYCRATRSCCNRNCILRYKFSHIRLPMRSSAHIFTCVIRHIHSIALKFDCRLILANLYARQFVECLLAARYLSVSPSGTPSRSLPTKIDSFIGCSISIIAKMNCVYFGAHQCYVTREKGVNRRCYCDLFFYFVRVQCTRTCLQCGWCGAHVPRSSLTR